MHAHANNMQATHAEVHTTRRIRSRIIFESGLFKVDRGPGTSCAGKSGERQKLFKTVRMAALACCGPAYEYICSKQR